MTKDNSLIIPAFQSLGFKKAYEVIPEVIDQQTYHLHQLRLTAVAVLVTIDQTSKPYTVIAPSLITILTSQESPNEQLNQLNQLITCNQLDESKIATNKIQIKRIAQKSLQGLTLALVRNEYLASNQTPTEKLMDKKEFHPYLAPFTQEIIRFHHSIKEEKPTATIVKTAATIIEDGLQKAQIQPNLANAFIEQTGGNLFFSETLQLANFLVQHGFNSETVCTFLIQNKMYRSHSIGKFLLKSLGWINRFRHTTNWFETHQFDQLLLSITKLVSLRSSISNSI